VRDINDCIYRDNSNFKHVTPKKQQNMHTFNDTYIVNSAEISNGEIVLWIEINGILKKVHNAKLNLSKTQKNIEISGSEGKISIKQFKDLKLVDGLL
jgi:hypothetical protein